VRGARDHKVIQHSNVEKGKGLLEAVGDGAVGRAGLGVSAGVVVKEDDRGGVVVQRLLGDDAGMDFAPIDGALKEVLGGKDAVAGVQEHRAKHFVIQVRAAGSEVVAGTGGVGDGLVALQATLQDVRGGLEDALIVHGQLVLGPNVVGSLHLLSPPARD